MINKDNLKLSLTEKEIKIINYLNISKKQLPSVICSLRSGA